MRQFKIIFFSLAVLAPNIALAKDNKVNILTWWGYLDNKKITDVISKNCKADVSFDEYYSNSEFLRRWKARKSSYDIIIYSSTVETLIRDELPKSKYNLKPLTKGYEKYVLDVFKRRQYPSNSLFFLHSLTGFLWNKKNMQLLHDGVA